MIALWYAYLTRRLAHAAQRQAELSERQMTATEKQLTVADGQLNAARQQLAMMNQEIHDKQSHIVTLLKAIKTARTNNPQLDVRIVLGKLFNKRDVPKEQANLKELAQFGLKLGKHIRYVDETRFVHLHNKLILIDDEGVLVSSQNWSNAAVSENREAGLWLKNRGINGYFKNIFESDWSTASKKLKGAPEALAPQAITPGRFVRVMAGDFREV